MTHCPLWHWNRPTTKIIVLNVRLASDIRERAEMYIRTACQLNKNCTSCQSLNDVSDRHFEPEKFFATNQRSIWENFQLTNHLMRQEWRSNTFPTKRTLIWLIERNNFFSLRLSKPSRNHTIFNTAKPQES